MTFLRKPFLLLCLLLVLSAPAASWAFDGPPAGEYRISGNDPGAPNTASYGGTLHLSNKGNVFSFQGIVDGQNYHGRGIYDTECRILSIVFAGEHPAEQGITVLKWNGTTLKGKWLLMNNTDGVMGAEEWHPVP